MKKNAVLCLVVLCLAVSFYLSSSVLGRDIERELRGKGIHVTHLSGEDKVSLQINRLEQAVREQDIEAILRIVSPHYLESGLSFTEKELTETLERSFANFTNNRKFPTRVNERSGWMITATHDFSAHIRQMQINETTARAECDLGFLLTSDCATKETVTFSMVGSIWLLSESESFFRFIETASGEVNDRTDFANALGRSPTLSFTEEDFVSTDLVSATLLYNSGGHVIPRMNMTTSQQLWGFRHAFVQPFGILADIEICQGGPDFNHDYLFVTDPMGNNLVASDQDDWLADYGEWGTGVGQFAGPYGICTFQGYSYFVADMFNDRVIAYIYYNELDEPWFQESLNIEDGADLCRPRDVAAKERRPGDIQERSYIAIADEGNHRIVLFQWEPYFVWERNYGEYGSGTGQFISPSSLCFGREPDSSWHTNDLFVTDCGNRRLVKLYVGRDEIAWAGSYQFPIEAELSSVDVGNNGLVYVVDRHNGKVYKFSPGLPSCDPTLLGIWGETGTQDGQLYYPNTIEIAHGRYVPYPDPWVPLTGLGDVFITESWGNETGVRRFVIAADVLNLTAEWVPYNEDTGEGNFIWWHYNLTDCGTVTEQVLRGGEVCTTYNEGTLNWGSQAGSWPVSGHPHGTYYTVKITAGSIYDPGIVVEKTVDVYVDTLSTHNPVITQGIRCHWVNEPFTPCDNCWYCIKENEAYIIDVQASHPCGYPLSYEWQCGRGHFWKVDDDELCNPCITDTNSICYVAPEAPAKRGTPPSYEFIQVVVRDPYEGEAETSIYFNSIFDSEYSCPCGDANGDSNVDLGDAIYIQNYLFLGFDPPPDPIERADANNDCVIDMGDVICILNYLFKNGPPPECCWLHE